MAKSPAYRLAKKKRLTPKTKKPRTDRGFFYVSPFRYVTLACGACASAGASSSADA